MKSLDKKAKWIIPTLVILLLLCAFLYVQSIQKKEEAQSYWFSSTGKSVLFIISQSVQPLSELLAEQEIEESKFIMISEYLHHGSISAGLLSSPSYSPQPEIWSKVNTSLDTASWDVMDTHEEYTETGSISQQGREDLKAIETLVLGIIDVIRSEEYSLEEGTLSENGIEKLEELTSTYDQQMSNEAME